MANGKKNLVRLNLTLPAAHWHKIQTLGSLYPESFSTIKIISLAVESMSKVTEKVSPDDFKAIARERQRDENWIHVTAYLTPEAAVALEKESERLQVWKSVYLVTALSAMLQEINLAALYALKLSFLQCVQRWKDDEDMANSTINVKKSGEPFVVHDSASRPNHGYIDLDAGELTEEQERRRARRLNDTMRLVNRTG